MTFTLKGKLPTTHKAKISKTAKIEQAEEAVNKFNERKEELLEMRSEFSESLNEEQRKQQKDIEDLEDEILGSVEATKELVRAAGRSIGDFIYKGATTTPTYDGAMLIEEICALSDADAGKLLKELNKIGLLKEIRIDKTLIQIVKSSHPTLAEQIAGAWDPGGKPLTASIFVPKIA